MNMTRWCFIYWSSFSYRHKSDQNTITTKRRKTAIASNEAINWHTNLVSRTFSSTIFLKSGEEPGDEVEVHATFPVFYVI